MLEMRSMGRDQRRRSREHGEKSRVRRMRRRTSRIPSRSRRRTTLSVRVHFEEEWDSQEV